MVKVGFITGITGQDGSYLAELLLEKDYIVYGMIRRSSTINTERIDHIFDHPNLHLMYGDLTDPTSIKSIIYEINNIENLDVVEVYNLGAQSHVHHSFKMPVYSGNVDALGTVSLLEAVRTSNKSHLYRVYQASTSELFGDVLETPQNEKTPFNPQSPYAIAKEYSHSMIKLYRSSYNMFACSGILFNHESPRRGHNFVTRKITIALGKICSGKQEYLTLGNLSALRDWGHSKDYVYGMWLMLQQDVAKDYVLATGEQHTVKEFVEKTFAIKGYNIEWQNTGLDEIGIDVNTGKTLIKIDKKYFRPAEVQTLLGDATLAKEELNWSPKISFDELVQEMVDYDCK